MSDKSYTFHLIANAHLDPVWLWDWREGLNEGVITCRTILNLMDEDQDLTFIRGESAIYRHIEEHDPDAFRRIVQYVEAGRWDVVGGTVIQPDTNLPSAETLARHFTHGQNYFISRFGAPVRAAWAADSFGHCAGLPEIMANAGIESIAFTRPFYETLPIAKPAFWWEAPSGKRILAYRPAAGWYGAGRVEMMVRLDSLLEKARQCDLHNVGVFYGLGNHGGGPSRRHLREIRQWAEQHPEIQVVHSGLHRFMDALRAEKVELPVHRGELNFTLRGCYSSAARFKFAYCKTENALASAERTDSLIRTALRQSPKKLTAPWDSLLFNSFHDILPGSSIERALDEQLEWLGGAMHEARRVELGALNALALHVDTQVAQPEGDLPAANAVLAWNPHPFPYRGPMEIEACLDYRMVDAYKGRPDEVPLRVLNPEGAPIPFQTVPTDNLLESDEWIWRRRIVMHTEIPAMGWGVYEFGVVEGAPCTPPLPLKTPGQIEMGAYRITAQVGDTGVQIFRNGKPLFDRDGLAAAVMDDPWGSWGASDELESKGLTDEKERWSISHVENIEHGPERETLWVRFAGKQSWMGLTFHVYRGSDAVYVSARLLWNERKARLKLVMPIGAGEAEYDVPGATVRRPPCGEVPGGRWVRVFGTAGPFGFASDSLYGFDCTQGDFRATITRATSYAYMAGTEGRRMDPVPDWRPALDCGEMKFRFLINPGDAQLPGLAQWLNQPVVSVVTPAKPGTLPRSGSFASLSPASLQMLALKRAEDGNGLIVRVRETTGQDASATLTWLNQTLDLGPVTANSIASWRLQSAPDGWTAQRTSIIEHATDEPESPNGNR